MFNSKVWHNSAPLQDIRLQNVSDLEFELPRSLKVKFNNFIQNKLYEKYTLWIFNLLGLVWSKSLK